jgi:hypothetical protein
LRFKKYLYWFPKHKNIFDKALEIFGEISQKGETKDLNAFKEITLESDSKFKAADKLLQKLFTNHPGFVARNPSLKSMSYSIKSAK